MPFAWLRGFEIFMVAGMKDQSAGGFDATKFPRPRFVPPHFLVALIGAATLLTYQLKVRPMVRIVPLGLGLLVSGVALTLAGALLFRQSGAPVRPGENPIVLVTRGPYRFTRNPMYLGMLVALAGLAFLVGTWPFFLAPIVMFTILSARFIPFEEALMTAKWGDVYREYQKRVRRWL
jgi:protein-S-isoprenylcysteine O-methyltransferase Ste14